MPRSSDHHGAVPARGHALRRLRGIAINTAFNTALGALGQVRHWSIDKRNLLLQNAVGRTLLLFRDAPFSVVQ